MVKNTDTMGSMGTKKQGSTMHPDEDQRAAVADEHVEPMPYPKP